MHLPMDCAATAAVDVLDWALSAEACWIEYQPPRHAERPLRLLGEGVCEMNRDEQMPEALGWVVCDVVVADLLVGLVVALVLGAI